MSDQSKRSKADKQEQEVHVHAGHRVGMTVSVRLRPDEAETLASLSRRYDMSLSDTLRLALDTLAQAADYTKLTIQSSGPTGFTRSELRGPLDDRLALTA